MPNPVGNRRVVCPSVSVNNRVLVPCVLTIHGNLLLTCMLRLLWHINASGNLSRVNASEMLVSYPTSHTNSSASSLKVTSLIFKGPCIDRKMVSMVKLADLVSWVCTLAKLSPLFSNVNPWLLYHSTKPGCGESEHPRDKMAIKGSIYLRIPGIIVRKLSGLANGPLPEWPIESCFALQRGFMTLYASKVMKFSFR